MEQEIFINSGNINAPVKILKQKKNLIGIEFMGIFFPENTGITTRINNNLYHGTIQKIQGNRAIIALHNSSFAWQECFDENFGR